MKHAWEKNENLMKHQSVFIGIPVCPSSGTLPLIFVKALLNAKMPPGSTVFFESSFEIGHARDNIVQAFKQTPCSHLLFLDSDVLLNPGTILKLLSHNVPVVSARYHEKGGKMDPLAFGNSKVPHRRDPAITWKPGEVLVEADNIGLGCCLIKKEVFRPDLAPYFRYTLSDDRLCDEDRLSEDFYFSWHICWKKQNFKALVDVTEVVGHLGKAVVLGERKVVLV